MAANPTDPAQPASSASLPWYPAYTYPGALRFWLRRALADTHADTTISERVRARWMATYQDMWDDLEKAARGRGRRTLEEWLASADGDEARREFATRLDDVLIAFRRQDRPISLKALAREMPRSLNSFKAWLKALGYGLDPRYW
jgi:hypothetical protein